MLYARMASPATLTGQLADRLPAAPEVATGSGFEHCESIAIEGGAG